MHIEDILIYIYNHPHCRKREIASYFAVPTARLIRPLITLEDAGLIKSETVHDIGNMEHYYTYSVTE